MVLSPGAGRASAAQVQPPCGCLFGRLCKCRLRLRRGDARGEAPCIRKLKISPFPPGRGSGGWGQKIYDMAGKIGEAGHSPPAGAGTARSAGDQPGKPPLQAPQWQGKQATQKNHRAPRWVPPTPAEPATPGARPPLGTCLAGSVSAAGGLIPGCRGRSPRRNKLKIPPSRREGGRGDGGKKSMIWQEKQVRQGTAPLRVPGRQGQQETNRASPRRGHGRQKL